MMPPRHEIYQTRKYRNYPFPGSVGGPGSGGGDSRGLPVSGGFGAGLGGGVGLGGCFGLFFALMEPRYHETGRRLEGEGKHLCHQHDKRDRGNDDRYGFSALVDH